MERHLCFYDHNLRLLPSPVPQCLQHKATVQRRWTPYFHLDVTIRRRPEMVAAAESFDAAFAVRLMGRRTNSASACGVARASTFPQPVEVAGSNGGGGGGGGNGEGKSSSDAAASIPATLSCTPDSSCSQNVMECLADHGIPCALVAGGCRAPVPPCDRVCGDEDDCCEDGWQVISNRTTTTRRVVCDAGEERCRPVVAFQATDMQFNKLWFQLELIDGNRTGLTATARDMTFTSTRRNPEYSQMEMAVRYVFVVLSLAQLVWFLLRSRRVTSRVTAHHNSSAKSAASAGGGGSDDGNNDNNDSNGNNSKGGCCCFGTVRWCVEARRDG